MMGSPAPDRTCVPVLMPVALDQTYDYLVPPGLELAPGEFVIAPFGAQSRIGIVWDRPFGQLPDATPARLKAVTERLEIPPLPAASMRFAEWVAAYTLAPLGMVARMMMSAKAVFEPVKPRFGVALANGADDPGRVTPARRRAMEIAADGMIRSKSALAAEAGCTTGVVDGLVKAGYLIEVAIPERRFAEPDPTHLEVGFSEQQARAV